MGAQQADGLSQAEPSSTVSALTGFDPSRNAELVEKLERIRRQRCDPKELIFRETKLTQFVASVKDNRVFCYGDAYCLSRDRYYPAVLALTGTSVIAYAASGEDGEIEALHPESFYPHIPYAAIAREVLAGAETTAIATETRRAETTGSVEDEGAGPQDIAHTQPPHEDGEQP